MSGENSKSNFLARLVMQLSFSAPMLQGAVDGCLSGSEWGGVVECKGVRCGERSFLFTY